MKYFVLKKYQYIRGFDHDMPTLEKCKNGFTDLEAAKKAKAALESLEFRPDMVSYILVKEIDENKN